MLYMWIFADNIEDGLGKTKFIIFYLLSGIAAALTQVYMNTESTIPMVGASGAIGGVLGAYIVNYPKAKVLVLIPLGFFSQIVRYGSKKEHTECLDIWRTQNDTDSEFKKSILPAQKCRQDLNLGENIICHWIKKGLVGSNAARFTGSVTLN